MFYFTRLKLGVILILILIFKPEYEVIKYFN